MNVLIIGSGGREHAIAWKIAQSPRLGRLYIAPGNPGTGLLGQNVPLDPNDHAAVAKFALEQAINLVIVGPEAPLALGLTDSLHAVGLRVFGPSKAAAQIEASKTFAKLFMARHDIPTARFEIFTHYEAAEAYLYDVTWPVVIKTDGLAAGKGVFLPDTREEALAALRSILVDGDFGEAGKQVVIEERLSGEEISLLAFTDGLTVKPMLTSQDHKRLHDGDLGPNTGGMGAYAPVPFCSAETVAEATRTILEPVVAGLRAEGMPFTGVLYAGLMLTETGPRVLEFNCRFGDPETQALMPLLASDLLTIADSCADQRLDRVDIQWKTGSAACVVMASEGYPAKPMDGQPIRGLEGGRPNTVVFHAGTRTTEANQVVSAGGRVLGVAGWGASLRDALRAAYSAAGQIHFEGMQFRRDIGHRALKAQTAYAAAGVNIDAGNRAVELMTAAVRSTYTPAVLAGIGAFGGLFDASMLREMDHPVLVSSTDGVGTKVKLAAKANSYHSVGMDIVNHCIDDILVQGAKPLYFLDYFATSVLKPEMVAEIVTGMATACREAGCALIGGETAEMPGVYAPGEFDIAGAIVGVVERERIMPRKDIRTGDVLVGLASASPHTNGYSLIRRIFADVPLDTVLPELGRPLGDVLLTPHRSYLNVLHPIISAPDSPVKALAHITGGGFIENIPRILPEGLSAHIRQGSWPVPALYRVIQQRGGVTDDEMSRVFNMGIGMLAVVDAGRVNEFQSSLSEESWRVGILIPGNRKVIFS